LLYIIKIWTFKVFVSYRGDREIDEWLDSQPKVAKAKIKKRITYLEISDINKWVKPYVYRLKGSDNIWEIRVISANAYSDAFRPLIPIQSGHPFRRKSATYSDSFRPAIPMQSGHP
jgi:hypothetical protein